MKKNKIVSFLLIVILCFISGFPCQSVLGWGSRDPDEDRSLAQLVESRGFALQEYSITTKDGYILGVHRVVPLVMSSDYSLERKPVIVGHCIYCSSHMYFVNSPFLDSNSSKCGDNFGFCLAKQGKYDVWLPNFRGNKYSLKHTNLSIWRRKYWEFSFQQKAQFDLPAVIELVQSVTQHEKVGYVGYSQGTVMMFALLSEQPQYADVIQPFIAWAPGLFMGDGPNMKRFTRNLSPFLRRVGGPYIPISSRFLQAYCRGPIRSRICSRTFEWVFGPNLAWNYTRWPVYARSTSHGSNWEMVHILQLVASGRLQKFDFGSKQINQEHYGQDRPPAYPIENIPPSAKIILMNGQTDWCMTPIDVARSFNYLQPKLGDNVIQYQIPSTVWGHLDFVFGHNAGHYVYDKTVEFLDQFTQ